MNETVTDWLVDWFTDNSLYSDKQLNHHSHQTISDKGDKKSMKW